MNKSPITYEDPRLIRFLENSARNRSIFSPYSNWNEVADDAKNVVNIEDWDIPVSEDMDADAFIQTLIEMERKEFWQKAEDAGIRVDLLHEVGYEFNYLSDKMAWHAGKYLERHLDGWPVSPKSRELLVSMLRNVVQDYEIDDVIKRAKNFSRYSKEESTSLEDEFFVEHDSKHINNHVTCEVAILFINEFRDSLTTKRRELFNLYGADFVALPEYQSFVYNRGRYLISSLHLLDKKVDGIRTEMQLLDMYKMLQKGKTFTLQSNIIKAERMAIDSNTASELAHMLIIHFRDLWKTMDDEINFWFHKIAQLFLRNSFSYKNHEELWMNKEHEMEDKIGPLSKWVKKTEQLYENLPIDQTFYYGAHSIIQWPEKKMDGKMYKMTDRCIFLYRLAHVCGFDKVGETLDLKKAETRKSIADRIKGAINKISDINSDGKLNRMLYSYEQLL